LIPAIKTNDINVIIAGMSYSSDRDNEVDFSNPYYVSDLVAVVKGSSSLVSATSIQELGGFRVISQLGTIQDSVIDQIDEVVHLTGADSFQSGALAVQSGDADALIAEYPVARAIVNADPSLAIVEFSVGFSGYDENELAVSVAVQEGNSELIEKINVALAKLEATTRQSMMDAAIERATE
jgi:ABC-type amino acid transport substrate-binding protein